MGFVNVSCALSGLPILPKTPVRALVVHAPPRVDPDDDAGLYHDRTWVVRGAAIACVYGGYLNLVGADEGPESALAHEGLRLELVEQPAREIPALERAVQRSMTLTELADTAWEKRVPVSVRLLGDSLGEPVPVPATVPTWRRVTAMLREASIPGRAYPSQVGRPYDAVTVDCDETMNSVERAAWSDRVMDAASARGWRMRLDERRVVVRPGDSTVPGEWAAWVEKRRTAAALRHAPRRIGIAVVRDDVWLETTTRAGHAALVQRVRAAIGRVFLAARKAAQDPAPDLDELLGRLGALLGRPAPPEVPGDSRRARRQRALRTLNRAVRAPSDGTQVFVFGDPILHGAHAGCLWQLARAEELSRNGTWSAEMLARYLDSLAETVAVMQLANFVGHAWAPSYPLGIVNWDVHDVLHEMYANVAKRILRASRGAPTDEGGA